MHYKIFICSDPDFGPLDDLATCIHYYSTDSIETAVRLALDLFLRSNRKIKVLVFKGVLDDRDLVCQFIKDFETCEDNHVYKSL